MIALAMLLAATVQGTAFLDDAPLPGCTVTLSDGARAIRTVSNAEGVYRIADVPAGDYTLTLTLDGLQPIERYVRIGDGANTLPAEHLEAIEFTEITVSCGAPCYDFAETVWDLPSCADYELDSALIEALARGDGSAAGLLRRRFENAFTYEQRHRIAAALLRRVPDDSRYWKELFTWAGDALKPAADDDTEHHRTAVNALALIVRDVRSRALLHRALDSEHSEVVCLAIIGLGDQQQHNALPAIERALTRLDDRTIVPALARFRSAAADAIAWKWLDPEEHRELYESFRTTP